MKIEYILLGLLLLSFVNDIFQKRKYQKLWQAVDKTKYINRYLDILAQTKDQTQAVKQLRQEFNELGLLQAVEISQLAHQDKS
ncbi:MULTISPECIES: hypothetical protein [Moraxella]|uniref:Uncharacterized protein n=1 Tax=Moraxella lacunata TaxID=477 RepID=A0A1B8Q3I4_MORLA|nr:MULTISPECIES: hypothetical protein [Moraxella]MBE9578479.1 hypothetical protein [Moraxella sp. K1664]MBE9587516.1 hypothetical protein [Moraxella sp. K1630]MBE9590150.1 hypothetical protein [Moraxella sp. K127]MBE9595989.1 hypothetical protein [Moraxella sp. K2450]MDH9217863.1 hypothetical protein [Moraxella lacunata]